MFVVPTRTPRQGDDILQAPRSKSTLKSIFMLVSEMHKQSRHYTFTSEARKLLKEHYDKYNSMQDEANEYDYFVG